MDERNYHSRLLDVSRKLDNVIETLKASYIDEKLTMPWFLWLLGAPLRDLAKVKDLQQGILSLFTSKAVISILPIITAIAGTLISSITSLPAWTTPFAAFILGYLISMGLYFTQLTDFKSSHFHLGAYKTWRKQEYEIFRGAFLDAQGEFYFKGLYDYVTSSRDGFQLIQGLITDFLQNERTRYESKIFELEEKIKEINGNLELIKEEYDEFTGLLITDRDTMLEEFEYVIQLLKDLNTLLFRIHNKGITTKDLNLLTGFTLYELKGKTLVQIEDVGTSGVTSEKINIDDEKYAHYGSVKVIKDGLDRPYFNHPYPGHVIVSYKMKIDQSGMWVFNFHFDDSNNRAWKLLVENGIIESKEIYRLMHALCLLSQNERFNSSKGAVNQ